MEAVFLQPREGESCWTAILANEQASATAIAKRIGVSRWYAGRIREGYRPHPRHWQALAELVGFQ